MRQTKINLESYQKKKRMIHCECGFYKKVISEKKNVFVWLRANIEKMNSFFFRLP